MSPDFDDEPLIRAPETTPDPETPLQRSPARVFAIIAAVGLVIGGLGAWLWESANRPPAQNASGAVTATDAAIATFEPARPLPPLDQMDTYLRALVGALSSHPELARWLATEGLIRQMADGIDKISRGQSPAKEQTALRPEGTFEISGSAPPSRGRYGEASREMTIDPASYRRYDRFAAIVASLDPAAVARAYRTIQPRLDEAYRALGRSESSVDEAVGVALDVLLATPTVKDPIRIVHGKGATYAFADPRLEALSPAQKHLLRMGPRNLEIIHTRLREIEAAINAAR